MDDWAHARALPSTTKYSHPASFFVYPIQTACNAASVSTLEKQLPSTPSMYAAEELASRTRRGTVIIMMSHRLSRPKWRATKIQVL